MKTIILSVLLFSLLPVIGKSNSPEYWTITKNDSTIYDSRADEDAHLRTVQFKLKELNLSASDTLFIQYTSEIICSVCEYNLLFTDAAKNKKKLIQQQGQAPFRLTLNDLTNLDKTTITEIFYYRTNDDVLKKVVEIHYP